MTLSPGSKLGRFQVVSTLGEGAMGVVYLAIDPQIERRVAIKIVRPQAAPAGMRQEIESRFLKEAKLAGRLAHPNIVTIYDVGKEGDTFFLAMEYIEGYPLTRFLTPSANLPLAHKVEIIRQVAEALGHAHVRGVLHRDIKPGNILLAKDGRVKVTDFGIGKLLSSGTADLTRTGQMLGSPAYMSPEQIRGQSLDPRSDLFSLGVVFYELLTGSRPFPGDSITTLVYQILHTDPRDPLELRGDLPASAREVLARLLAKSPEKRPGNAREFIREAERIGPVRADGETTWVVTLEEELAQKGVPADRFDLLGPETKPAEPSGFPGGTPAGRVPLKRPGSASYLFGAAAVLAAIGLLLFLWRATERRFPEGSLEKGSETLPPSEGLLEAPKPLPAQSLLPTAGPSQAADAIVGVTREVQREDASLAPASREAPAAPKPPRAPAAASESAETSEPSAAAAGEIADNLYRTRRSVRFGVSPEQVRIWVDGRYVGVADDWDDRGGGRQFEFEKTGSHRVHLELPGYRDLNLEVVVSSGAEEETVEIDDELERHSRVSYPKLPSVAARTTSLLELSVDPPDAIVSQGGRELGPASSFGPGSPLKLSGTTVHDLLLSAPGRRSKTVRILVAPNAGSDLAQVKVELKKE